MQLVIGNIDIPYAGEPVHEKRRPGHKPGRRRTVDRDATPEFVTTGEVAGWLEREYGLAKTFYELHQEKIQAEALACVQRQIANLAMGAPAASAEHVFAELEGQVTVMYKRWISQNGPAEAGVPGTPTKAAQAGVSHRMKHPYAKRGPRVSFIDTAQFEATIKVWVE